MVNDILDRVYANSDDSLHTLNCSNRDFYAGKCRAVKEIKEAFIEAQKEADNTKMDKLKGEN